MWKDTLFLINNKQVKSIAKHKRCMVLRQRIIKIELNSIICVNAQAYNYQTWANIKPSTRQHPDHESNDLQFIFFVTI